MKNKELSETDNILEEVIKLNKQGIESYRQEQYEEAIKYYNEALEIVKTYKTSINNNDYAKIFYNKARAYEKINNLIMSIKFYDEALKTDSTHVKAREYLDSSKKAIVKTPLIIKENEIEKIIISKETNIVKISCLKQLEEIYYKPLIKELAYKKTIEGIKDLVVVLNNLGFLTTKLGDLSDNLKYYTDAAVFYQHALTIIEEKLKTFIDEKIYKEESEKIYVKLNEIKENIISAASNSTEEIINVGEETLKNKQTLANLRKDTKERITEIEEYNKKDNIKYINLATELFQGIARKMEEFLAELYKESEQEIGKPPCQYTVIGLGSMALQQMTPYSDLEFAILTENDHYKESLDTKIKEYFKNLTHLVNLKIINLGETSIPFSKYNLDLDHLIRVAVNFDLGGKTPLGRIENDKPYELIQTVEGMLWYMRNKEDKASHIDKNLPYILEKVCYVYGNIKLITQYKQEVEQFLLKEKDKNGDLNCEARALKVLKEECKEINYNNGPNYRKEKPIKGNLEQFQPNLIESEFKLFDVKQNIYRLPDRFIHNLGLYFGVQDSSAWGIIDKLFDKKIINLEAYIKLKEAVTFATTLRLKTYLHYERQEERMSMFPLISNKQNQVFHLSETELEDTLFKYFYTSIQLHEKLKEFCYKHENLNSKEKHTFFTNSIFYTDTNASKGLIYYRLAKYDDAKDCLEKALEDPENQDNLLLISTLGHIYIIFGLGDNALKQFRYCYDSYKDKHGEIHPDVAISLDNMGIAYNVKGEYDKAIDCHKESKNIRQKLINNGQSLINIDTTLHNLGNAYYSKGNYEEAIKCYEECLKIRKSIYKEEHELYYCLLENLGSAYDKKCKNNSSDVINLYNKTINTYKKSLELMKKHNSENPDIFNLLHKLGNTYYYASKYYGENYLNLAIECYEEIKVNIQSIGISERKLLDPNITLSTLINLGHGYYHKIQYNKIFRDKATENYKLAKKLICSLKEDMSIKSNQQDYYLDMEQKIDGFLEYEKLYVNKNLKGINHNKVDYNIDYINPYFGKYTLDALVNILQLRLVDIDKFPNIKIQKLFFVENINNINMLTKELINPNKDTIIIPINLYNKHAAGLVFEHGKDNFYQIKYIDPMNNPIPSELLKIIQNILPNSQYKQIAVEQQRYANCGPEVVENFILYLTGNRISQEKAIELHSKLVENSLLDLTIPNTCLLFEQSSYDKFQPDICLSGNHNEEIC